MPKVAQQYDPAVPVDQLSEHPDNPRVGDVRALGASMGSLGFYGAVIAQKGTGAILAGNHRYRVARKRGRKTLPVLWLDVDDDRARRILLADNRVGDLAEYNDGELERLLQELVETDLGLEGTGWTEEDLAELLPDDGSVRDGIGAYNTDPTSDDYYTPAWVFEALGLEFDLDVASPPKPPEWIPAKAHFTMEDNGLASPWRGLVWMNPPYSKPGPWVERFLEHGNGVALLPFSNAAWWRNLWASDVPIAVHLPRAVDFVGGGHLGSHPVRRRRGARRSCAAQRRACAADR